MEKKYKQNLFVSLIFALIVSITLFYMHDNYIFQTYGDVVYYDSVSYTHLEEVMEVVAKGMTTAVKMNVELKSEGSYAINWYELK